MEDWPQAFADYAGINLLSGQVILSIVVIFTFLLPVILLSKGKAPSIIYILTIFFAECLLVGIGWLNFWIMIASIVIMALGASKITTDLVTGGG